MIDITETDISIEGMSCQHCVTRVKKALEGLAGVQEVLVEVGRATVRFDESRLDPKTIEEAVKKSGYVIKK